MHTQFFFGTWNRLRGQESLSSLEISSDLEVVSEGSRSPFSLDEHGGGLVASDRNASLTHWFPQGGGIPALMGIDVGSRPWSVWTGQRTAMIGEGGASFQPQVNAEEFLGGWQVRVSSGDTGGRDQDHVRIVLAPDGLYDLEHGKSPDGPWTRYDRMEFNDDLGALESTAGHRSLSLLIRDQAPERVLYAMYCKLEDGRQMPFEHLDGDGSGAWGAEGG